MSTPHFETLLAFFKALANESRLKLVGLLAQREYSVEEMAALLKRKEPTVSHHLVKLKQLKLVEMRQDKNTPFYKLNQAALQSISKAMFTPEQMAGLTADVDADGWETKILRSYFEDGRLRELDACNETAGNVGGYLKWSGALRQSKIEGWKPGDCQSKSRLLSHPHLPASFTREKPSLPRWVGNFSKLE